MLFRLTQFSQSDSKAVVSVRCHGCRQIGTFESLGTPDIATPGAEAVVLGQRRCPNPECRAHVFVVRQGASITTYPPERLDFDAHDVPERVRDALAEAITCHANECYKAAGMMVRKTMELLCEDRLAEGNDLKDRIADLRSKVLLPPDLLDGADDLRLLGNDAAHVTARAYEDVGKAEVELGIEFAREVLKAVYQYQSLVARLRALKKQPLKSVGPSPG